MLKTIIPHCSFSPNSFHGYQLWDQSLLGNISSSLSVEPLNENLFANEYE
jgi:hypothetical protein